MATWAEARAAKSERQRREQRHYYSEHLGKKCPECGLRVVAVIGWHATCGPEARWEMRQA